MSMPLTAEGIRNLRTLVDQHFQALIFRVFTPESIAADQASVARLVAAGILDATAVAEIDPIRDMYLLGFLEERIKTAGYDPKRISEKTLRDLVSQDPTPMTLVEADAIAYSQQWSAQYIQGLGNRVAGEILSTVNAEDATLRANMLDLIRRELPRAQAQRMAVRQVASKLSNLTEDWTRDWLRIAASELQDAHQHGVADSIRRADGVEARVAKIPNPDACDVCLKAYLDEAKRPKIFTLEELIANGTNVGRKKADMKPVLGIMHPYCHCELVRVPDGWEFDDGWILRKKKETKE